MAKQNSLDNKAVSSFLLLDNAGFNHLRKDHPDGIIRTIKSFSEKENLKALLEISNLIKVIDSPDSKDREWKYAYDILWESLENFRNENYLVKYIKHGLKIICDFRGRIYDKKDFSPDYFM